MEKITIAYMIQAHKNADAVNRLVSKLDNGNSSFFIHIDKKSEIYKDITIKPNVHLITDRVDVKWGHISQVEATLKLMCAVKNSGKIFDYVWLISGQDFPIKNNSYINDYLAKNYGSNFIEILGENDKRYRRYLKRNETWYPIWGASPKFIMRVLRKIYNILTGGMEHSIIKRKNILGIKYAFGSQWFTIRYDAMLYILDEVCNRPYIKFYKNCICPDESFFQTILYNSKFKDTIRDNLLYVDWSEGKKNPKILSISDFDKLEMSEKLIARKFDGKIHEKILKLSEEN